MLPETHSFPVSVPFGTCHRRGRDNTGLKMSHFRELGTPEARSESQKPWNVMGVKSVIFTSLHTESTLLIHHRLNNHRIILRLSSESAANRPETQRESRTHTTLEGPPHGESRKQSSSPSSFLSRFFPNWRDSRLGKPRPRESLSVGPLFLPCRGNNNPKKAGEKGENPSASFKFKVTRDLLLLLPHRWQKRFSLT